MNKLIKLKAYDLWLNYNKPKNKDLDIWLEAEKYIYNSYYETDLHHKGEGAYFRTNEINNKLNIILCPYKYSKNYRKDDILLITSNHFKYYNCLYIKVDEVNKNGKILKFDWTFGEVNKSFSFEGVKYSRDFIKFGNISRYAIYIGRLKNKQLILSDFFYCNGEIKNNIYNIKFIKEWCNKHI